MNTPKIAGLYAASHYDLIAKYAGCPDSDISETFEWGLRRAIWHDDNLPLLDAEPTRYHITVNDCQNRRTVSPLGDTQYGLADLDVSKRLYDWALGLLPAEDNRTAGIWAVSLHTKTGKEESTCEMRLALPSQFGGLLRGLLAYQNKRRKYLKKTLKQLAVYHQQLAEKAAAEAAAKEAAKLKQGLWFGQEKALTTAARMSEPGVPFMGDASLTDDQRKELLYWAVNIERDAFSMDKAFPTGTGLALKQVKRSRELVNGAVYLYEIDWSEHSNTLVLGRLDMSAKQRGFVPLRSDSGAVAPYLFADWTSGRVKIYRVLYYTTRAAEELAPMVAETQPAQQQPAKRQKRRELAHAA